ncbi:MAG: DUF4234 domain-containing protein [Nitrososphaerota archaeon]
MAVPKSLMLAWMVIGVANLLLSIMAFATGFSAGISEALSGEDMAVLPPPEVTLASSVLGLLWGLMLIYFIGVMRTDIKTIAQRLAEAARGKSEELLSSGETTRAMAAGEMRRLTEDLGNSVRISSPWVLPIVLGVLMVSVTGASAYITSLTQEIVLDPLAALESIFLLVALSLVLSVAALAYLVVLLYSLHTINRLLGHVDRVSGSIADVLSRLKPPDTRTQGRRLGSRRTLLYIILTLITLGFFLIYWVWALNSDLGECETRVEDLLSQLKLT